MPTMERRLTAILAADVVGYSRLMSGDEAGTLVELNKIRRDLIGPSVTQNQGRIVKLMGDGMLIEFPSVVSAMTCAVEMQKQINTYGTQTDPNRRLEFRVGVNLGDVMIDGEDIYGDGVNIAARLQSLAPAGGITVSQSVRDHAGKQLAVRFQDRGEQHLKNIEEPIRVYDVVLEQADGAIKSRRRSQRPSIAVLPFTNMSGDPEQEYFSDGITEDIVTDLSKVSGLSVIARQSAFSYKSKPLKVQQIGQELGADFVVEGSVRKAGARVRVTGQLVSCKDGTHLWAERFDRDLTDIFAIQDEITHAIVAQLKVKLLPQERKSIEQMPTNNVEAYSYYLRGREFLYRHSKRYYELARRMFTRALELDQKYSRAYAGIAVCDGYLFMAYQVDLSVERILEMADKALALESNLAIAHTARGVALSAARRFDEANLEFEKGIALDPNSFETHFLYARPAFMQGQIARAVEMLERAAEINPNDYKPPALAIHMYRSLGRENDCKEAAHKTVQLAERELISNPEDPRPAVAGALALLELGERGRAKEWATRAQAIENEDPVALYNIACVYSHLGEPELALDLLERVIKNQRPMWQDWIPKDSDLDAIRTHPRYQKLLQRLEKGPQS